MTGSNQEKVHEPISQMRSEFAIWDVWPINYFFGINVKETELGLFLSQQQYLVNMLNKFELGNLWPMSTIMEANVDLFYEDDTISFKWI